MVSEFPAGAEVAPEFDSEAESYFEPSGGGRLRWDVERSILLPIGVLRRNVVDAPFER